MAITTMIKIEGTTGMKMKTEYTVTCAYAMPTNQVSAFVIAHHGMILNTTTMICCIRKD